MLTGGNVWTQQQIDDFMKQMENETFNGDRRRGTPGKITKITREDTSGNETTYVNEDGEWSKE